MKIVEKIRGRRSRLNRRRAFTLIEMLAALALAMILLYILFQIFTTVGRAMTISNARSEIHANARAILRIMHQEISGAFLDSSQDADSDSPLFPADYFVVTDDTWNPPWDPTTSYPADRLQFLTSSALGRDTALSEISYWLARPEDYDSNDPDSAGMMSTLRRRLESDSNCYVDGSDASLFNPATRVSVGTPTGDYQTMSEAERKAVEDAKLATILGENVLAFNVEYYDAATDTFASGDYTATEKRLTTAVRITLRVQDSRGRLSEGEEFVEIIAIKGRE